MNAYVHKEMQIYTQTHPLKGVQVNFVKDDKGQFKIAIKGQKREDIATANQQILKFRKQCSNQYLKQNHYQRFITYDGVSSIKPDHVLIAQQSVNDLKIFKKLVLEEVTVKNIRKVTNFVLGFVQSIPSTELASRVSSAGLGFHTPLTLLYQNKGDSNSKVTLTAAILRALMPRINMVIVYLDHHALFGINVLPQKNEVTLKSQGVTYVLAEPLGPKLYPLGEVAPFSKQAILSGIYTIDKFK